MSSLERPSAPDPSSAPAASPVRIVTATSLFDGHDAAINIMRRILQAEGAEVIHLGHDRSVIEIVDAAIQEDAHAIAVSSYQGGHMEFFRYMVELLRARGRSGIRVFGGGGGTITDREIDELHAAGVTRIYSVEDGRRMGLVGMIRDLLQRAAHELAEPEPASWPGRLASGDAGLVARSLTLVESWSDASRRGDATASARLTALRSTLVRDASGGKAPIVGVTGTGGAGKSSLTDELVRRALAAWPERRIGVLSVDPTRRRSGGALLGDRIRMNALASDRVYMRSFATRQSGSAVSASIRDALAILRASGCDLIFLETAGIGQSGSEIVDLVDLSLYVMTPEFGAPTQLEKIDMLDYADLVAVNKADKQGAADAVRHVARQLGRNRNQHGAPADTMPVVPCMASHFGDRGVDDLFGRLAALLAARTGGVWSFAPPASLDADAMGILPPSRSRYLSEIAGVVRSWKREGAEQVQRAAAAEAWARVLVELGDPRPEEPGAALPAPLEADDERARLRPRYEAARSALSPAATELLRSAPALRERYRGSENVYAVRGREIRVGNHTDTLAGTRVPKVAVPRASGWDELLHWRWFENVPGEFPFTAGVFPYKRTGEDPTRLFAGEGTPERTNRRFHLLCAGQPAARISTAFDSVTLYGRDPDERPDVLGKVGNSGVSVPTLDDAKRLYSGFDLCSPSTSVSMTINGPAPILLAMFLNTAIDQQVERRLRETGRWDAAASLLLALAPDRPRYREDLPPGHAGSGLGLLGASGDQLLPPDEYAEIREATLCAVRGTVQADILKEDQAQNTCIFSTDFALRIMGDIQQYFIDHSIRNFYSVSISGYHIAEAGANPISQLAFTLANGFTYAEYYRARGMPVDAFAPNISFFFSNGTDAEYAVIGRVARRIWAVAMQRLYGAGPRSQQLKYHIQTSGRSLHAQEMQFNDIRTTLQALYALADNCSSLHTNAYDEAITTPTPESVRRALAIQLILNREYGLLKNENPLQGSWLIEYLTDAVEEAVLDEFERLADRGGVLGAMETLYQRSRIQEESLHYERLKHSGELPIVGVNTFLPPEVGEGVPEIEMARSTDREKLQQLDGVRAFHARNATRAPAALASLRAAAGGGRNLFASMMEAVKSCSLGQIANALFDVGGQYRRNM